MEVEVKPRSAADDLLDSDLSWPYVGGRLDPEITTDAAVGRTVGRAFEAPMHERSGAVAGAPTNPELAS